MTDYRYVLELYQGLGSRFDCPACETKHQFTRYIDSHTDTYIDPTVGKCNREVNCGYHLTPKQYFQVNGKNTNTIVCNPVNRKKKPFTYENPVSDISFNILNKSLAAYHKNNFVLYLFKLFGSDTTTQLISKYFIGTSNHWSGATVFWQVDQSGKIKSGKIMLFDSQLGKRIKIPFIHITWVHKLLKIDNFKLKQCLFGEHLLKSNSTSLVAIVESEKTAIICSVFFPQFIWLAVGSLSNLSIPRLKILNGRKIYLFPDLGGYDKWKQKLTEINSEVTEFNSQTTFVIADFLEKNATKTERENGFDLADYLTLHTDVQKEEQTIELNEYGYPALWDD